MKFIHTGDIHYGMAPDSDKPWSKERTQSVKDALTNIVYECNDRQIDCLLIAGDLFHHQPLARELKEVNYLFTTIPDTHVVIIAGNHDSLRESSAVMSFGWASNVSYITTEDISSVYLADINTEVSGFSYHIPETRIDQLENVHAPSNNHIHILLAHGGDSNHAPFSASALSTAGFSYCALGHIHKPEVLIKNSMAFCGSPEPLDMTETGPHGYYVGEIDDNSHIVTSLTFIPAATVLYIPLIINVTASSTNTELLSGITAEINRRGSENIYRLKIRGMRDPDIEFDVESLESRYRIVEILDESEPKYDFTRLYSEHPSDMIGFFVKELNHPDISEVEKKALYYGVNALLHTTEGGRHS